MGKAFGSAVGILVARGVLLAVAGGALVTAVVVTGRADRRGMEASGYYVCPMHSEVTARAPGECPICRMQLEAKTPNVSAAGDGDSAPASFVLPQGAEVRDFEDLGYGKMYEMSREMRAAGWAETGEVGQALLYKDEIALLEPAEAALFFPSTHLQDGTPAGIAVARIDESPTPWDDATALVRFRATGKTLLVPGQTGWVKFGTKVRAVRAVRSSAIIQSPAGPYVLLVGKDERTFTKRPIRIGSVLYDHAAVLSGLDVGERIATLHTFELDAERRFSGRAAP